MSFFLFCFFYLPSNLFWVVTLDIVHTAVHVRLARQMIKCLIIDPHCVLVLGAKNHVVSILLQTAVCAASEHFFGQRPACYTVWWDFNCRWSRVFNVRQREVSISELQKPFCKGSLVVPCSQILRQLDCSNMPPERRRLQRCTNDGCSAPSAYHRQHLSRITTEDDHFSTKWQLWLHTVLQECVDGTQCFRGDHAGFVKERGSWASGHEHCAAGRYRCLFRELEPAAWTDCGSCDHPSTDQQQIQCMPLRRLFALSHEELTFACCTQRFFLKADRGKGNFKQNTHTHDVKKETESFPHADRLNVCTCTSLALQ